MRIVVVPGAFTSATAFDGFAAQLEAEGHDVTVVELPARSSRVPQLLGGGLSRIDAALDEIVRDLPDGDLVLVGHSLGGLACLRAARRWSAEGSDRRRPRGVALLTPAPPGGLATEVVQLLRRDPASALKFAALAVTSTPVPVPGVEMKPPRGLFTDRVTEQELEASVEHRRDESWLLLGQLMVGSREDVRRLDVPALVVGGEEDGLVPAATCARLAEQLGARYEQLPVGHAFAEEAAGQVVTDVLLDWLRSLPRASRR